MTEKYDYFAGTFLSTYSFPQTNIFLISFTTHGRTPYMSDQLVSRPLLAQYNAKQRDQAQASMPQTGLETAI
jgi:hypothetical protein